MSNDELHENETLEQQALTDDKSDAEQGDAAVTSDVEAEVDESAETQKAAQADSAIDNASCGDDGDDWDESKPRTAHERVAFPAYDFVSIVGTAIAAIMVVFTFFFRFVGVVGPSMQPTLIEDDWLAVTAFTGKPEAGDIVIITQPNAFDEPIVKRVVATGGQTVDISGGRVYIDGEMLVETYIAPDVTTEKENLDNYPLTVPEGQVFVLGDNRHHSTDSRSSMVGLIDNNYILGKVKLRILPFGSFKVGNEYDYSTQTQTTYNEYNGYNNYNTAY